MKRLLFSFALLLATVGSWAYDFEANGIYYKIVENGVRITSGTSKYIGDIVIPETVSKNGRRYTVIAIDEKAFYDCSNLKSIIIPNSVTKIGKYAFSKCSSLTSIVIPNSVTTIEMDTFSGCSSLTTVTIPSSVTTIGANAFYNSGITSFVMSDNISEFGHGVFDNTPWYESQSPGVIYINDYIVYGYKGEKEDLKGTLELKQGAKIIANSAFSSCSSLTSIKFPNSLTKIGSDAFKSCININSVTIPKSVKEIGQGAFSFCSSLTEINVETGNSAFSSIDGAVFNKEKTEIKLCPSGFTEYAIPDFVTAIGDNAFYGCYNLASITIPNSVTSIGKFSFYNCRQLTSIEIPNSVTIINDSAFYYCDALTSISLPSSLTTIGNSAFANTRLKSIEIPNSVTTIGDRAFESCSALTNIKISKSVVSIGDDAFRNCTNLLEIEIPNTVKSFTAKFNGCKKLKKIYLSENVTIPERAFTQTSDHRIEPLPSLEEISVSKLDQNIGKYFASYYVDNGIAYRIGIPGVNCEQGYTEYSLPENLTLILRNQKELCKYALQDTKVINIVLETPIKSIGTKALENSGVTKIALDKDYWTTIESGMFSTCHKLQKLELPFPGPGTKSSTGNFGDLFGTTSADGLRDVVQYLKSGTSKTYYIPVSLTELVLSEGCEIIPYGGLSNCNMLEKVTLPTSLYMVGEKAFYGCAKIGDIYCKGADPAVAYDSSFEGMRVSSCKLHIPYNTAELYKRSTGWKTFYYFEEEAPLNISVTKNIENAGVIYGINEYQPGQTAELKAVAHSGYTFKGWTENGNTLTTDGTYSFVVTDSRSLTAVFAPVLDENDVEVSAGSETAAVSCQEVEGASSYRLDVYSDADMTIPAGSASSAAKAAAMQTRAAAATKTLNVDGLNADTRYYYLLTALSEEGIVLSQFSGSFVTASATGISETANTAAVTVTERYDASGRRIDAPAKGLNILRMSDGTVRKVLVK